nr:MAG TPA: hypothetical protein [Caudoviricetes sp.]
MSARAVSWIDDSLYFIFEASASMAVTGKWFYLLRFFLRFNSGHRR